MSTSADVSEVLAPPRFVNAGSGDLHLAKGSPAINAGENLAGVTADLDSNARPLFNVHDIGAYEYTQDDGSYRVLEWEEQP